MKKVLDRFEYYSILLAACGIIVFVFFSIILRYVFNIVLSWPDELSRYLQIYIVWMGVSASFTKNRVLKIDFLHLVFSNKRVINLLADAITLFGSLILMVAIFKFTHNKWLIRETSMILEIPIWIVGFAIGLSVFSLIVKVLQSIIGFFTPQEAAEAQ